ncbi:hypothetical protein SLA2020_017660 [Shorea laevis]
MIKAPDSLVWLRVHDNTIHEDPFQPLFFVPFPAKSKIVEWKNLLLHFVVILGLFIKSDLRLLLRRTKISTFKVWDIRTQKLKQHLPAMQMSQLLLPIVLWRFLWESGGR